MEGVEKLNHVHCESCYDHEPCRGTHTLVKFQDLVLPHHNTKPPRTRQWHVGNRVAFIVFSKSHRSMPAVGLSSLSTVYSYIHKFSHLSQCHLNWAYFARPPRENLGHEQLLG